MIVVTGATGSLGSNLTKALVATGAEVAILRREQDDCSALGDIAGAVRHRIGDVRDPDSVNRALADADQVYHLAGIAVPSNALRPLMESVNVTGTANVMAAAHRRGARVVHTSSVAAIGYPDTSTPVDENFAYNGPEIGHAYMDTKFAGERVVHEFADRGLDVVIVNPTGTMAPGGSLTAGWAGLVAAVGRGNVRAYPSGGVGVLNGPDMADIHLRAMEFGKVGERYIANSVNLTYRDLINEIAAVVGVAPARWRIPNTALYIGAAAVSPYAALIRNPLRKPLLRTENVRLLTRTMFYDAGKAQRDLGAVITPLRDSIRVVAQWCQQQGAF